MHQGQAKIPTRVWWVKLPLYPGVRSEQVQTRRYDTAGTARAFGAETKLDSIQVTAELSKWQLAECFKLHLHPATMRAANNISVPPLPQQTTLEKIYADFFAYLH